MIRRIAVAAAVAAALAAAVATPAAAVVETSTCPPGDRGVIVRVAGHWVVACTNA